MKKQKRSFIIILILLAVLVAATVGLKWYNKTQNEKKEAEDEAAIIYVTQTAPDEITAFSYELDGVDYSFTKDGDQWTYDGDKTIDLDEDAVSSMLGTLESLTATDEIDNADLSEYGLNQPSDLITFTTSQGVTTISVGNKNEMLGSYYIMTGEDKKVYLTKTSLADRFSKTMEDLTVKDDTESVDSTEE